MLGVGRPGPSRGWGLLYTNGTPLPPAPVPGLLAVRSQQTLSLCGAQARSFDVTGGSRAWGWLQHPSFSASFDLFWSQYSFPNNVQLTGSYLILPTSPFCARVPAWLRQSHTGLRQLFRCPSVPRGLVMHCPVLGIFLCNVTKTSQFWGLRLT